MSVTYDFLIDQGFQAHKGNYSKHNFSGDIIDGQYNVNCLHELITVDGLKNILAIIANTCEADKRNYGHLIAAIILQASKPFKD